MKNTKAIYLMFAANTVSGISQGISLIAIPWFIANDLEQPALMGALFFISTTLSIFWGSYAGTLIDKFDRKKVMLSYQIVGFLLIFGIGMYGYFTESTNLAMACGVFLITKIIYNIHYPNLYAFAQEITEKKHFGKITSYIEIQGQTTMALAGGAAAILMEGSFFGWEFGAWEVYEIFILDAATYVIGFLIISLITYQSIAKRTIEITPFLERLKTGLNFLLKEKDILLFGCVSYMLFACILICSFFTLPIFIENFLNETEKIYGLAEGTFAFGSLMAGIFILTLFPTKNLTKGITILLGVSAVLFFMMGLYKSVFVLVGAYLFIGFCNAGIRILRTTYIFRVVPNTLIGRVSSVFMVINSMFRLFFAALFSMAFFAIDDNIKYSMFILAAFIGIGFLLMIANFSNFKALNNTK